MPARCALLLLMSIVPFAAAAGALRPRIMSAAFSAIINVVA